MAHGVTTPNLTASPVIDSLIGSYAGSTRKIDLTHLVALVSSLLGPAYATRDQLLGDLGWPDGSTGYVHGDSTTTYNGVYKKSGGTGSGSWTRIGDLPTSAIDAAQLTAISEALAALDQIDSEHGQALAGVSAEIEAETTARTEADAALATEIGTEVTARTEADTALLAGIEEEIALRQALHVYEAIVQDADGFIVIGYDSDRGELDVNGLRVAPGDLHRIADADGVEIMAVSADGQIGGVFGADRIMLSADDTRLPGPVPRGAMFGPSRQGDFWQYDLDDGQGTRRFLVHDTLDAWAPHVLDTPVVQVIQHNGQSWACRVSLPENLDVEDPSGEARWSVERIDNREALGTRLAYPHTGAAPWWYHQHPTRANTYSLGIPVSDFRRSDLDDCYTIGDIATSVFAIEARRRGLRRSAVAAWQTGWSGSTDEYFLPGGASYTYVNSEGDDVTIEAALKDGETGYLWDRDVVGRDQIEAFTAAIYRKRAVFDFHTWIQGPPAAEPGRYAAFLEAYRGFLDALELPTSDGGLQHFLIDQMAAQTTETTMRPGAQEQLEWAQANTSGRDWMVGPRYPYRLEDVIHHSAMGCLLYGEQTGIAMAELQERGTWEPLWITNVAIVGQTVTLSINRPRQSQGGLVLDVTSIEAAQDYGFSLRSDGSVIAITSIDVGADQVVLTAEIDLDGMAVEVGYAAHGVAQPAGTVASPQHSGCWGNIKRVGRHVGPYSGQSIDQWLCSFCKIFN